MSHQSLTPVFAALRTGLHVLVAGLLGLVLARTLAGEATSTAVALVLIACFAGVYCAGAWVAKSPPPRRALLGAVWVGLLTVLWVALLVMIPEAAYLAFPLFFLYLHVLPPIAGPAAVIGVTVIAIIAIGASNGYTIGGVVGPLVGAGVALLIGWGYQALARESTEREALLAELIATRDQLAATEREQGILAERGRLAREIHDTIAQGLSSIQMLLHAAERTAPAGPTTDSIVLAREAAADALSEARRFIRELNPPSLDDGLPSALRRLAASQQSAHGLTVDVSAPERIDLTMEQQTALLRVAQGALANVVQHAQASRAHIELAQTAKGVVMSISDDGVGFDPAATPNGATSDSFGLRGMSERMAQINGTVQVDAAPGRGAAITVTLERPAP